MRHLLGALLMAFTLFAVAAEPRLIPVHTPRPGYPPELKDARVSGNVRVHFIVHEDGSVSDVKAIESADPLFSESAINAVSQWRFRPWTSSADLPAQIEVFAPMVFFLSKAGPLPLDINTSLRKISCSSVNQYVAEKNAHYPRQALRDLDIFNDVVRYVSEGVASSQLQPAERTALIKEMVDDIPQIIQRCEANPNDAYVDQLPAGIKALL